MYQATLLEWLTFCMQARIHVLQARRLHIEQWAKSLSTGGAARSTVVGKLVPVCGFYRWAHQEGLVATDEGAHVRRPSRPRRSNQKWLEREDATRLLAVSREFGPPADALVHLFLLNGLRHQEVLDARLEHLGTQGDRTTLLLPSRKAGVMDRVSLPTPTIEVLAAHTRGRSKGFLIRSSTGRQLKQSDTYRIFNQLGTIMDLDHPVRPHMLRATFVTLSLDAGVPARDVMASTGHAHTAMVDYYDRAHASIRRNASHRLAGYLQ